MKKLINISVIATLAVLPMVASANTGDIVAGEPVAASAAVPAQSANSVTTSANPKYALAVEGAKDGNLATVGYVKGAYNASMKAINSSRSGSSLLSSCERMPRKVVFSCVA